MEPTDQHEALPELAARGLIATNPAPRLLTAGNRNRLAGRSSWQVQLRDGQTARLLLAPNLADQAARQNAFHAECPQRVPRAIFHERLGAIDALAEAFISGRPLADAATVLSPRDIQFAFAGLVHALAATCEASSETARRAEWDAWSQALSALPGLGAEDRRLLGETILPALYPLLTAGGEPATRRTNGDFTADNILVAADGNAWLTDLEFSARTHFFGEDAARFHVFSSIARQHPTWFGALPDPGPAWHLYFWLRQLQLETASNTPVYLAGTRPLRLGVIRRLAEHMLAVNLETWSVPALPVASHLEQATRAAGSSGVLTVAGWCHVPSASALRAMAIFVDDQRLIEVPLTERPDVESHFKGEARARLSGFHAQISLPSNHGPILLAAVTADGTLLPFHRLPATASPAPASRPAMQRLQAFAPNQWPLLSVVMPVYNPPLAFLEQAVASVTAQTYPNWELCVIDDASPDRAVHARLVELAASDARIRLQRQPANGGISAATNAGVALARGSHVAFLDHDDELTPEALAEVAAYLLEQPGTDILYTDQDKCDEAGRLSESFAKPGWSPVYFLGVMYVGHLLVARTALVRRVGGCDPCFDRIQDYELMLRLSETSPRIAHLPRTLYHWRTLPGSIALSSHAKGSVDELQVAAVQAHFSRRKLPLKPASHPGLPHRVQLFPADPTDTPLISVILATPDPTQCAALGRSASRALLEIIPDAATARGDVLVWLDPGWEIVTPDWLPILHAHLALPGVGAVSPRLVGRENQIEYAGTAELAGANADNDGPGGMLACSREVPALAESCVMLRRDVWLAAGATKAGLNNYLNSQGLSRLYVANVTLRRT